MQPNQPQSDASTADSGIGSLAYAVIGMCAGIFYGWFSWPLFGRSPGVVWMLYGAGVGAILGGFLGLIVKAFPKTRLAANIAIAMFVGGGLGAFFVPIVGYSVASSFVNPLALTRSARNAL